MIPLRRLSVPLALAAAVVTSLLGCSQPKPAEPEYARPLPPGTFGLRRVTDPARMPDLDRVALQFYDPAFQQALDRSIAWFQIPSTQAHFRGFPISHTHAHASVVALRELGKQASYPVMMSEIHRQFDVWESIGWDGSGEVLFTGYYAPVYRASYTPTGPFQYPIYSRPGDLVTDVNTGAVVGRRIGNRVTPYPTRAEIEAANVLAGHELVYLPSRLDAYAIEVNGSAKLQMTDGSTLYVGYAGTNGHDYVSIGKLLVEDGKIDKARLSMPAIRRYFAQHPDEIDAYISQNPRMAFFKEYDGNVWPAGSLGVQVTPMRTLATDKSIFPRGCVVLVETAIPEPGLASGGVSGIPTQRSFHQLMLDQDTGGAIRAAGRADIYCGVGPTAERVAGGLVSTGRMYYLLLKTEYVNAYLDKLNKSPSMASP